jgi:SAM-dependent methyltransferase
MLDHPLRHSMLDHPLRHIVQNFACYLPGIRRLQEARATTGVMNNPAVMAEWAGYIERDVIAAGKSICGTSFLEIGPGHSIGVALKLLEAGAKEVYALDVKEYADLTTVDPKLRERLHYAIVNDEGDWPIEPGLVDVVYSYFSGEHLRYPSSVVKAIARVLRQDGLCIFVVDLEDHAHRDTNRLQFLYYEPKLWNAMFSQRGVWTNRLLEPDWRDLFEHWFENVEIRPVLKPLPECFDRKRVATSFRKYPESALFVSNIWVVATSPRRVPPVA